jgi:hypothetical protein
MKAPSLPKKIKQDERDLDQKVANAVSKKHPHPNWGLEVKTYKGKLKAHQKVNLKKIENGTFLHKFKDAGAQTPFDYIKLGDADAIVCVIQENLKDVVCEVNDGVSSFNVKI